MNIKKYRNLLLFSLFFILTNEALTQARFAYIHGNVGSTGETPAIEEPFEQMLLTDTTRRGMSQFKQLVEDQGYTIDQYYDAATTLDANFLNQFDVIIFGLHQKIWSSTEKAALDTWIRNGGGIWMYSDSAAGGFWRRVGIENPVGQNAVNNILNAYGLGVSLDYATGNYAYAAPSSIDHPIVNGGLFLQGEGVSLVGVDESTGAQALMPISPENEINQGDVFTKDGVTFNRDGNMGLNNYVYAAIGLQTVGAGNVIATFDRQPMWNRGPGSRIGSLDNREILRRIVVFLAEDTGSQVPFGESIEATTFTEESHPNDDTKIKKTSSKIGSIKNDTWIKFEDFNFGSGVGRIDFELSKRNNKNANVDVRLDSPTGQILATISVTNTGGWNSFQTFSANLNAIVTGVSDLYFTFSGAVNGNLLDFKSFALNEPSDLDITVPANAFDSESNPGNENIIRDQGTKVGFITNGSWISYSDFNFDAGAGSIDLLVSKGNSVNAVIEVRTGSESGQVIATIPVSSTGGFRRFQTFGATFNSSVSGVQDLFLVFSGANGDFLFDVKSFVVNSN